MPTPQEIQAINAEIFAKLETSSAAIDAVNEFTRFHMYHKFTGMPKRGFASRIMPPTVVRSRDEWLAMGVKGWDLLPYTAKLFDKFTNTDTEVTGVDPWWNTGDLFYEIAETKLDREDYERRLAARRVDRYEWHRRQHGHRFMVYHRAQEKRERLEAFAYSTMGDLLTTIVAVATRTDRG